MAGLTAERLRELLSYDAENGIFLWKVSTSRRVSVGAVAGCVAKYTKGNKYRVICIDKKHYLAHRLAWLHVHGEWPPAEIDHINRDGLDNSIANLRSATREQNQRNVGLTKRNSTGAKGIRRHRTSGKWMARIYAGREYHLGTFDSREEAVHAHALAASRLHREFAVAGA